MKLMRRDYPYCRVKSLNTEASEGVAFQKVPLEKISPNYKGKIHKYHHLLKLKTGIGSPINLMKFFSKKCRLDDPYCRNNQFNEYSKT